MASSIWVFSWARLRSTSAWAEAGIAGSWPVTSGHVMVPGPASVRAFVPPLWDVSPARAKPAIAVPDSATAAAPPMNATRRLLYFGRALDMGVPH